MNSIPGSAWLQMARDVIEAAHSRWTIDDYERFSKITNPLPGRGYLDRMRIIENLIDEGVVVLESRRIIIGRIDGIRWIEDGLARGSKIIWDFACFAEPSASVIKKFDSGYLAEIGRCGELAVMAMLRESLPPNTHHRIHHISLTNDAVGFDISAPSSRDNGETSLIEVKTTVRPDTSFPVFLSRNEFRVGSLNQNWWIVCVRIIDDIPTVLGHIQLKSVDDWLPRDIDQRATWETVKLRLDPEMLISDLP